MFTSLLGTTMRFTMCAPCNSWAIRGSPKARSAKSSSCKPPSTRILPRTRPLIWMTISTCSSSASWGRYSGHRECCRLDVWPSISQSSSARCGAMGASISVKSSRVSLTTAGCASWSRGSDACRVLTSSMIRAIDELKCQRASKSCVTRRNVWCALRRRAFSLAVGAARGVGCE